MLLFWETGKPLMTDWKSAWKWCAYSKWFNACRRKEGWFLEKKFPSTGLDFLTYHGLVSSIVTYQKKRSYEWEHCCPSRLGFKIMVNYFERRFKRSLLNFEQKSSNTKLCEQMESALHWLFQLGKEILISNFNNAEERENQFQNACSQLCFRFFNFNNKRYTTRMVSVQNFAHFYRQDGFFFFFFRCVSKEVNSNSPV